ERDPASASVLPYVQFWKGEIAYRLNNTDEAIKYYFDYLKAGVSNGEVNPAAAKYNLGYGFIKKENYTQAAGFFDQLVTTPQVNSPALEQDAYLRSADCAYMSKDYTKADEMYTKVLDFSWPSSDYATFQKAMIAGVKSSTSKINLLTTLTRKYTSSPLLADANMEIANALLADELYKEAIPYLKNVIADPNASLKPKSQLRLGIAYYNLNNNKEALNQYTSLLKQFPNSAEAESALENAKTIYVDEGRTAEYVNFARSMGKEVTTTQEEELAYQEAEVQFNNGNLPAAAKKFEDYLAKYPIGKNSLEALYLKSDIYYNRKEWAKAEQGYEILSERVPHKYGEKSLLLAARINFFDLKKYDSAEKYYLKLKDFASTQESRLEAMRGLLRSQFQLEKWSDAVENAEDLLAQKSAGTDDKILANIAIARSAQENQKYESAITAYRTVASLSKSAYGAEARFEIARCYFLQNRYDDAEKAAFEVIKKTGSYEIWVTKAYLLLGDVYYAEKDYFNAKATYRSVVQNARSAEVREEAETKLNKVTEEEIGKSKLIQ
ncbi:MAG TPA: tetratricopeptide repeat protein, partial [Flavitalea sp.]|nr:tetratricopeptide repeat protein [Flavitalea sp.]